ncbi:MAG: primosomal protein N' [Nitrospirota bacterium]
MDFIDVVFPLNIGPLTYHCREELSNQIETGMIVSAPIKNRVCEGIVIGRSLNTPSGRVKAIQGVRGDGPLLSGAMIELLKWMSKYYLVEKGLVLKNMLPRETFGKIKRRSKKCSFHHPAATKAYFLQSDIDTQEIHGFLETLRGREYRTFLVKAPSTSYEYSLLVTILPETENVIVLVPELSVVHQLYPLLAERFGKRVCPFHSGLSRSSRFAAIDNILSGTSDIILGTRSAIFAPLKKVSFIAVLQEHSNSYKQENMPCYSGRDVAVVRGYLEKATVLLSSICPSVESLFNCQRGKYTMLKVKENNKRPKVKIVDIRYEKLRNSCLSRTVLDHSSKSIKSDRKVIFILNRRGYSTQLQCADCNYVEECPSCKIPLVLHRQAMLLKCHYCNLTLDVPERCSRCKGHNIRLLGAGTQKVQENIEELMGVETMRIDSDRARKKSDFDIQLADVVGTGKKVIIGTKLVMGRLTHSRVFSTAVFLNPDLCLNIPDFRSAERTFQEIAALIDKVEPDGTIFIQTRMPQHYVYKYLKNNDYPSFVREELERRRSLRYPPYSRLILVKFLAKRDLSKDLAETVKKIDKNVEVLGPSLSRSIKDTLEFKILLKSSSRDKLHFAARAFVEEFKNVKDMKIRVDVDPVKI